MSNLLLQWIASFQIVYHPLGSRGHQDRMNEGSGGGGGGSIESPPPLDIEMGKYPNQNLFGN